MLLLTLLSRPWQWGWQRVGGTGTSWAESTADGRKRSMPRWKKDRRSKVDLRVVYS